MSNSEPTNEMVEAAIKAADWPMYAPYIEKTKRALRAALAVMPSEWNAAIEAAISAVGKKAYEIGRQECCGRPAGGYNSPPECCGAPDYLLTDTETATAISALRRPA